MANPSTLAPAVKSTFAEKEEELIAPEVLVFRYTETAAEPNIVTARSGFPSPSKSPMPTIAGDVSVGKSTLVSNEPALITPDVLVFRNTEIVVVLKFVATTSGFPSPSRSPIEIPKGPVSRAEAKTCGKRRGSDGSGRAGIPKYRDLV